MNRIKELRKLNKMTQKELAEKIKVTVRTIQHWESGGSIKSSHVEMLAEVLGADIDCVLNIARKPIFSLLPKGKQYLIRMNELTIDLIRDCNKMTVQEVSDTKREARNLYEELVRLEYEAKEGKND